MAAESSVDWEEVMAEEGRPSGFMQTRGPMFGRQAELRAMEDAYDAVVADGATHVLTLVGSPGIGKTRLVQEFVSRAREMSGRTPPRIQRATARPHGAAFDVLGRLVRGRFEIPHGIHDEVAKERLREQVAELLGDRKVGDVIYFLGGLIELKFDVSPLIRAVEDDPAELNMLRRAVLKRVLEADAANHAQRGVLVLVLEDLHHAHDDTLQILEYLAAHLEAPLLVIATARPELLARRATWTSVGGARHTVIEVGPLAQLEAERMMEQLLAPVTAGGGELPQELIESACELAGGNPALLERTIRILHDSGVLVSDDIPTDDPFISEERWKVNLDRIDAVRLPMTVQDAVAARLSALSTAERDMLEKASVMGSVFWLGGLVVLGRIHQAAPELWAADGAHDVIDVLETLEDLVARDYVLEMPDSTFPGEREFVFKHNLERESLERLIPAAVMKRYHQAIADWLEFRTGVRSHEEHVAGLAWHREKAGARTRAALTWIEAGDIARSRYANGKAAEYYARGLDLLGEDDARSRLEAHHHYGDALCFLGRFDEALAQFGAMQGLAYALDLKGKGGAAHNRIGRLYRDSGRLEEAARHLGTALALFTDAGDERGVASSLDDIGKLHWMKGDYESALRDMRQGLATRKQLGDRRSIATSLNNLGLVLQDSGHFKEALEAFEYSLRIRREIGDLVGVVATLNNLGTVAQDQRDDARAMQLFTEGLALAREIGDRHKTVLLLTNIGETWYRMGDVAHAVDRLKESERLAEEIGDQLLLAEAARGLGKAYLLQGDLLKARDYSMRAVELFEQVRSKVQIGVAVRTLGEVTAAGGWGQDEMVKAKDYFQRAIALFREVGNEVELARTYRSYAEFIAKLVEYPHDPQLQKEKAEYDKKAEDVFAKLRISAIGIDPNAFFS